MTRLGRSYVAMWTRWDVPDRILAVGVLAAAFLVGVNLAAAFLG